MLIKSYQGLLDAFGGQGGGQGAKGVREGSASAMLNHLLRRADNMAATATRGAVCFPRRVAELLRTGLDLCDRYTTGKISAHGLAVARGRLASAQAQGSRHLFYAQATLQERARRGGPPRSPPRRPSCSSGGAEPMANSWRRSLPSSRAGTGGRGCLLQKLNMVESSSGGLLERPGVCTT
jgi:hypothetical protein